VNGMQAGSASVNWTVDGDEFVVLINDEQQYSIWPSAKCIPQGWTQIGPTGPKAECLAFVETRWNDMRPRSLRDTADQS
jgi:MbtH protein